MKEEITDPYAEAALYFLKTSPEEIKRIYKEKEKQCMDELFKDEEPGIWAEPSKKQSVYIVSKWTKFRLFFAKKYLGTDTEGDITSIIEIRKLKDVVYITHTWMYKNGKLIKEDKL